MDELIRQTGAEPSAVLTVILELELAGRCRRHPGQFIPRPARRGLGPRRWDKTWIQIPAAR